jgi:hypothetical protein
LHRKREERGSGLTAWASSSLQNKSRVSPFLLSYRARGWSLGSGRVRWRELPRAVPFYPKGGGSMVVSVYFKQWGGLEA